MLTIITHILSVCSSFLEQADIFFLPCPFKYITGIDCPGCGFQRSLLALLKGNLQESLHLYPATLPLLFTFGLAWPVKKFSRHSDLIIKILYLLTGSVIFISYLLKVVHGHLH